MTDQKPEFPTSRKGYDRGAVDAFVSRAHDQLVGVRDDLAKAREDLVNTQEELTTTQAELEGLRNDIDGAREAAAQEAASVIERAEEISSTTTGAAEERAAEIIGAAEQAAEAIREAVEREEAEMQERLRTRENEITAELDAIDARVGERTHLVSELEERLAAEEARYADRIRTLKTVANGLEDALRVVAEGGLLELGVFLDTHRAAVVDNDIVGAAVHHHYTTDALLAASPTKQQRDTTSAAPPRDTTPVDVAATDSAHDQTPTDPSSRRQRPEGEGSFYSRRSAGLPSLGENQGQSILAAMGSLFRDEEDDEGPAE